MTTINITPNEEIAELQRDEVEALQAIFETALELVSSRQKSSDEEFEYDFPIVYNIHLNKLCSKFFTSLFINVTNNLCVSH